jgi:hypothetical protein
MKIIHYISTILGLCTEFMLMWVLVNVCGRDCTKFACLGKDFTPVKPAITKSPVRSICRLFKYASDFIWMLGKNNLDSLVPAGSDTDRHELL